ncbi:MAG TPA: amidohydrolase family protein [Longimicrobiales bacterium]|nr:amidohydrolase family protein [Longimicrobiales bacterium]
MRRSLVLAPVLAAAAMLLTAPAAEARQQPIVIRNVSVIPMDREEVLQGQTVVVRDGSIVAMGENVPAPDGATVVDGTGRFLMPGLAEMHAHVAGAEMNARILPLFALHGITTVRGMLGAPQHLVLRDSLAAGHVLGPRLVTSGPSFSGAGLTPEAAAQRVRDQHAAGYDLLKIHPGLTRATFDAMASAAGAVGLRFSGHVPLDVGLDRAIEARYETIDHLDGFMEALLPPGAPVGRSDGGWFGLNLVPYVDMGGLPGIVARVRAAGIAMVPTQTLMEFFANDMTGDELAAREDYAYWVPGQVEQWRQQKNARLASADTPPSGQRARYNEIRREMIRVMHDAGVAILLGSDAPQVWNVPGFSTHRELAEYVAAGLTPYQALRTGTTAIAEHLGEVGSSGVVRPGARADLVLLDANPLEDIGNTLRIHGVIVNGRWIGPSERQRLLDGLRTR